VFLIVSPTFIASMLTQEQFDGGDGRHTVFDD